MSKRIAMGLLTTLLVLLGCKRALDVEQGGLYSVAGGDGGYQIAKVLVVEAGAIHIRLYKNKFATRPTEVDPEQLSLGKVGDPDGFGMGHLPLSINTFLSWQPRFLQASTVAPNELEGYKEWQEGNGGLF